MVHTGFVERVLAQNKKLFREKQSIQLHVAVNLCHMNFLQMYFQNKIWLKVKRACEKTKVFSCVLLLIDTTVVIFYKKVYTPPFPIRMLLWNPMRQLRLFSVYCDIYKDCVQ